MIIYNEIDGIGSITISSGKGNLLDRDDLISLQEIVLRTASNDSVKGLLMRGDNRCFSTGLAAEGLPANELSNFFALFDNLLVKLFSYPKPVVAVIEGHSIGGGLLLQCCADYVVAADNERIKIGLPELKIGLTLDELMVSLLKFNTGNVRVLQELLYSGQYIGVNRAREIGFIDCIVAPDKTVEVSIKELNNLNDYNDRAFSTTKLKLRAHTAQRMVAALGTECYRIFNEL